MSVTVTALASGLIEMDSKVDKVEGKVDATQKDVKDVQESLAVVSEKADQSKEELKQEIVQLRQQVLQINSPYHDILKPEYACVRLLCHIFQVAGISQAQAGWPMAIISREHFKYNLPPKVSKSKANIEAQAEQIRKECADRTGPSSRLIVFNIHGVYNLMSMVEEETGDVKLDEERGVCSLAIFKERFKTLMDKYAVKPDAESMQLIHNLMMPPAGLLLLHAHLDCRRPTLEWCSDIRYRSRRVV